MLNQWLNDNSENSLCHGNNQTKKWTLNFQTAPLDLRLLAIFLFLCLVQADINAARPNILLLFSDDHQVDLINAQGNPYIDTPNLDRLVTEGLSFNQTFAEVPTCQPSRASLLTGCSALTHQTFHPNYSQTFNRKLARWPQVMQDAGYETFWTGKWNSHGQPKFWGITKQSCIATGGMGPHIKSFTEGKNTYEGFSSTVFADAAIRYLKQPHEKPFFMTVAFTAPHDPRTPPKKYRDRYKPHQVPVPGNFYSSYPYDDGYRKIRDEKLLPYPRTVDSVRQEIALYYGMISQMDEQIGRILETLKETGLDKNTVIIYTSDNGLAIGHHGLMGKFSFYRHSFNVPLIMKGPGIPAGKESNQAVYLHDLFPTICEMTGIDIPDTVESKSFLPIIQGKNKPIHEYIFGALSDRKRSVSTLEYRLVRHYKSEDTTDLGPSENRYLFFDLKKDPLEMVDRYGQPEYAEIIADLKQALSDWQKQKKDFVNADIF